MRGFSVTSFDFYYIAFSLMQWPGIFFFKQHCNCYSNTDYTSQTLERLNIMTQLTADSLIAVAYRSFWRKKNKLKGYLAPAETQQHAEALAVR